MILVSCLDTVMPVAEALPVALMPEQHVVSPMRFDVIHIGRLDISSFLHALHTQRVRFQITLTGFVPCGTVASTACGACLLRMEGTMLLTVFCSVRNKCCTAGMLAWRVGSVGHWRCPLSSRMFQRVISNPSHYLSWEGQFYNYFRKNILFCSVILSPHYLSWESLFYNHPTKSFYCSHESPCFPKFP